VPESGAADVRVWHALKCVTYALQFSFREKSVNEIHSAVRIDKLR